jgi:hypothetical protein
MHVDVPVGPLAHRGKAIESGLEHLWSGGEQGIHASLTAFDNLCPADKDPDRLDCRLGIAPMLRAAHDRLGRWGRPIKAQQRVEIPLLGCPVPLIGYADFVWLRHVLELKTTEKIPSAIRPDHKRQGAVYGTALRREVQFAYVSPARCDVLLLEKDAVARGMDELASLASRLEKFLGLANGDPKRLFDAMPPGSGDWKWAGLEEFRRKHFGL